MKTRTLGPTTVGVTLTDDDIKRVEAAVEAGS